MALVLSDRMVQIITACWRDWCLGYIPLGGKRARVASSLTASLTQDVERKLIQVESKLNEAEEERQTLKIRLSEITSLMPCFERCVE